MRACHGPGQGERPGLRRAGDLQRRGLRRRPRQAIERRYGPSGENQSGSTRRLRSAQTRSRRRGEIPESRIRLRDPLRKHGDAGQGREAIRQPMESDPSRGGRGPEILPTLDDPDFRAYLLAKIDLWSNRWTSAKPPPARQLTEGDVQGGPAADRPLLADRQGDQRRQDAGPLPDRIEPTSRSGTW